MPRSVASSWLQTHAPELLLVAATALLAGLAPLYEVDLAQHLATGEWIARNGRVPFVEPFAWTRAGEPYFAYSWLAQLSFYTALRAAGPLGLHLLEAVLCGAAAVAALWSAAQLRWSRTTRLVAAALTIAVLWSVSHTVRPQQLLLVSLPLIWGIAARIESRGARWTLLAAAAAASALAVNTHLFFPITLAPALFFLLTGQRRRDNALSVAAVLFGWLLSPYALAWPRIFALNFGHNVLLERPPAIREFIGGFEFWSVSPSAYVVAVVLALLPWLLDAPARTRVVLSLYWLTGLLLFGFAGRLLVLWWALAFPAIGIALERGSALLRSADVEPRFRQLALACIALVPYLAAIPAVRPDYWRYEGDIVHRMLPRAADDATLWLPSWLLCHTRPGAHGRIYTEFNYGSELTWRLPGYSVSIDGRTIFPDSIAADFAFAPLGRVARRRPVTWTSAELALVGRDFWLSDTLSAHAGWIELANAWPAERGARLFATRDWWQRWGAQPALPDTAVFPGEPRTQCSAAGSFPRS